MGKTFILVTQEAEKLGAKHLPVFFETPCTIYGTIPNGTIWELAVHYGTLWDHTGTYRNLQELTGSYRIILDH